MPERSKYQQGIIRRYYENQDAILVQRLGELVTNLYLAEGKARQRLWKNASTALTKLRTPASRIEQIVAKDDPAMLARLVEELLAK